MPRKQLYYESLNGNILVARIDGSEFTLKRYYIERDHSKELRDTLEFSKISVDRR